MLGSGSNLMAFSIMVQASGFAIGHAELAQSQ
jgi:hypothetical protein